jgi:hypothetical protein
VEVVTMTERKPPGAVREVAADVDDRVRTWWRPQVLVDERAGLAYPIMAA